MENLGLCVKKTIRKIVVETDFYIQYSEFAIISNDRYMGSDVLSDTDFDLLLDDTNDIDPDSVESFKKDFVKKFKPIPNFTITRTKFCEIEWKEKGFNELAKKKDYILLDVSEPFMNDEFGVCVYNTIGEIKDNSNPFYTIYRKYRFLSKIEKELDNSEEIKTYDLNLCSEDFDYGNSYLESYVFSQDLIKNLNPIPNTLQECHKSFEWNFDEEQMLHFAKAYNKTDKLQSINSLEDFKRHEYGKYKYIPSILIEKTVRLKLCHEFIPKINLIRMEFYIIVKSLEENFNLKRDLIKKIFSYVFYKEKKDQDFPEMLLLLED